MYMVKTVVAVIRKPLSLFSKEALEMAREKNQLQQKKLTLVK